MCVARVVPLPGRARPSASVGQFMELAVNMPEHDPQVGQAFSSTRSRSASEIRESAESAIGEMRFSRARTVPSTSAVVPPSIGPPETNTVGMSSRRAAMSMPGVILSQFEMHTSASAQCAFTMYSTQSAIRSREGSE